MDNSVELWKKIIVGVIVAFFVAGVVDGLYTWYKITHMASGDLYQKSAAEVEYENQKNAQQETLRSLTAPAPAHVAATSTSTQGAAASAPVPSQKAPSSLNAPASKSTSSNAPSAEEQATINSLSAPN